ncbi:hypothetical protein KI688_004874 [Linnemannia hyalina]|uniref:Uncharacterized protein n=1 Tax=Linnemannia hyalina TaxID=64524 RepID=A0A9P8BPE2_9FUNG|nr:hypothetical protein KI688_004869 [Linnemannia hyalina]KAG9063270.1 hypothetical protein KI688_004874 [Linnemannia hyalina]
MKSGAILTLLACLCLTFNAEAFNFGKLLGTIAGTVDGVGNLLNGILGGLATEQLGFLPDVDFKARLVGANALCQLESRDGIRESDTMCGDFGKRYYSEAAGKWACGRLRSDAMGVYSSAGQSHGRALCSDRKPMVDVEAVDDEIEPSFHDSSSFYAKALAADLYKYTSAFNDTLGESEAHTTAVLTTARLTLLVYAILLDDESASCAKARATESCRKTALIRASTKFVLDF